MHDILVVLVHSIVTFVRLIKPRGLRAVVAESASLGINSSSSIAVGSELPACVFPIA